MLVLNSQLCAQLKIFIKTANSIIQAYREDLNARFATISSLLIDKKIIKTIEFC